jgi:hypothetical protein
LNGLSSLRLAPLVLAGLEILADIGIMGVFHKGAADPRGRDIAYGIMGLTLLPLAPCVMPALFPAPARPLAALGAAAGPGGHPGLASADARRLTLAGSAYHL